ncbi:hypothetical protein WIW50_10340 [Flavobacteriaceae bacterium 3-367]
MKKLIFTPIVFCLLLFASCEESDSIADDLTLEQLQENQIMLSERQAILSRVIQLQDAIQNKNLTPEVRVKEIKSLINDIEGWNARPDVKSIAMSTSLKTEDPRGPRIPPQPCLLIPPNCAPIKIIDGSICFYIGVTNYCGPNGLRMCRYACISDLF